MLDLFSEMFHIVAQPLVAKETPRGRQPPSAPLAPDELGEVREKRMTVNIGPFTFDYI